MDLNDLKFEKKDFFRLYRKKDGNVVINKVKMQTIIFARHVNVSEGGETTLSEKVYMFVNPFGNRLAPKKKIKVQTRLGDKDAIVVSSIKIPQKYLGELFYAIYGHKLSRNPLQPVIGVYEENYVSYLDKENWQACEEAANGE